MEDNTVVSPTYNLWDEPWIGLERRDGTIERVGIGQALRCAEEYMCIYDPSPLVVVGIHRLLTSVLQASLSPRSNSDLEQLWRSGRFPEEVIANFERRFRDRFDLFSASAPFLQSADLATHPSRGDPVKTVVYLMQDIPAGTAITHYRHGSEDNHFFCPACAAAGIVMIPAFATSGGSGIKPSINGVPPIYILPGGANLFESLASSLLTPPYFPSAAGTKDMPWWERSGIVPRSSEVAAVGYLHSLTFPARRVRLHPERLQSTCTRCGQASEWGIRTMIFEMGESRPEDATPWLDPFAAYKMPGKGKDKPTPIRPAPGKATWREFSGLFLHQKAEGKKQATLRPRVLEQIKDLFADEVEAFGPGENYRNFRCVGLRTDMKGKVFEWIDAAFDVPMRLLVEQELAGKEVDEAVKLAEGCAQDMQGAFRTVFNPGSHNSERYGRLRTVMLNAYWTQLAEPFRQFVLKLVPTAPLAARGEWAGMVIKTALSVFRETMDLLPDDAATLRKRVQAEQWCAVKLNERRKKEMPDA